MEFVDKNVNEILNEEVSAYEMAYTRPDAIERRYNLGEQFAKHFIKICEEGKGTKNFVHHCAEMQSWWDKVRGIKLKENNKLISLSNLTDWFFTLGKDPEDFIPDRHLPIYSKLYLKLLSDREIAKVQDVLEELL